MQQQEPKASKGRFFDAILKGLQNFLPSPFTLAVLLTLLSILLALLFTGPKPGTEDAYILQIVDFWQGGIWNLLEFAMQMMLMLVLGHVLALSKFFDWVIKGSLVFCKDTASAALTVTLLTVLMGLFNWGLGLIFGAILARKMGEYAQQKMIPLNYPLIGAAGYAGLLVWHGGLSGSAPLKVAQPGHQFVELTGGQPISATETLGSTMNIVIAIALIVVLPTAMWLLAKRVGAKVPSLSDSRGTAAGDSARPETPAERLDFSGILSKGFGLLVLFAVVYIAWIKPGSFTLDWINPNSINLLLFALCLISHRNFMEFLSGVDKAIKGSAGIMIQFPLYAGILGILSGSGMIEMVSDFFVRISNETTFPLATFYSAGMVNFFVPSGGGQWAVQGGIILDAAQQLGISQPKAIMAMCYGDQLTNMLQPFWALPLLGITGLKAREILPYTVFLMLVALIIFNVGLLIF